MKYLKGYSLFNEDLFTPEVSDAPDLKMAKEKLNTLKTQIEEFKTKKNLISQAYIRIQDDKELSNKIKEILGPEVSPKIDRNPFLVEYLNVSDLKRRLEKLKKNNIDDKIKLDDFNQDLSSATDSSQKSAIQLKISDINKRMGLTNDTISKIIRDTTVAEKSLNDKINKQEKDMKDYIKNITDKKSK